MVKEMEYKKAFVELCELLKHLPAEQIQLISTDFLSYIYKNRDENYVFSINEDKDLLEQDYMTETKALIVKMYEEYIAIDKEFWNEYDRLCLNEIEKERQTKFSNNLFN